MVVIDRLYMDKTSMDALLRLDNREIKMAHADSSKTIKYKPTILPDTSRVPVNATLRWLKQGANDFSSAPAVGIGYGVVFALVTLAATYASYTLPQLTLTFFTAVLIIGPFLATGLYKVAKRRDAGKSVSIESIPVPRKREISQLAVYIAIMLLVAVAWIRMTSIAVAVYLNQITFGGEVLGSLVSSTDGLLFLGMLSASVILFAFLLFALSTIALPMIIDGKAEAVPAMITSLKTVFSQPATMLAWATLVAVLTVIGLATLFIGLVFIFPILGYATWHSYQDLVK
jgi:uncharacterized membrane protein